MPQHACHTIVLSVWDWWEIVKLSGENMWEKEEEVEGKKNTVMNIDFEVYSILGSSSGSVIKNLPANVADTGLILGSGRSPEDGNGNPL